MNIQEAINNRRTAHKWNPTLVPESVLFNALEAAQMAPCHRLTWPWRFTIPGPDVRQNLYELSVQLKAAKMDTEPTDFLRKTMREKTLNPALIVVSQVLSGSENQRKEDYAACACAIQNLCLSVTADGYQSKWSTGGLTRDETSYALLNIPTNEEVVGFIWIGEPKRISSTPPRTALEELVRRTP